MPMGISTSLDANGLGGRPEKSHPPRGISPIFARLIKTQTIACGIGQPRLAPAPFFILRHLVEAHRAPRKIRDPRVERAAFQIEIGSAHVCTPTTHAKPVCRP